MDLCYQLSTAIVGFALSLCVFLVAVHIALLPPHTRIPFSAKQYNMPPGARGSVAFGNLTEWLHARNSGNTVSWLVKQARFGEFTTLSMGTKTWILLNSGRVVNEIIAKHASVTHERPHFPIAGDLVSRKKRLFLQKTDDWKEGRRFFHQLLLGASSKEHGQIVEAASVGFLRAYLDHPKAWYAHNYRYAVAIMHKILTNKPLEKSRAELDDLQRVTSTFLTAINSSFVEFFLKQLVSPDSSNFGDHGGRKWEHFITKSLNTGGHP